MAAPTAADLRAELNAGAAATGGPSDDLLTRCINVADELLKQYAGTDYRTGSALGIPITVAESAQLAVAVEIFNQRKAPNGVLNQAFSSDAGGPLAVRIGADPLRPAYGLLSRWVVDVGFA